MTKTTVQFNIEPAMKRIFSHTPRSQQIHFDTIEIKETPKN